MIQNSMQFLKSGSQLGMVPPPRRHLATNKVGEVYFFGCHED